MPALLRALYLLSMIPALAGPEARAQGVLEWSCFESTANAARKFETEKDCEAFSVPNVKASGCDVARVACRRSTFQATPKKGYSFDFKFFCSAVSESCSSQVLRAGRDGKQELGCPDGTKTVSFENGFMGFLRYSGYLYSGGKVPSLFPGARSDSMTGRFCKSR